MSKETSLQRSENRGSKQHKKHMNICSIEEASEFIRRLDAIIALLTLAVPGSLGEKIVFFHEAGLRPAEIAEILGKNLSYIYITKELTLACKGAKKSKRRRKVELRSF